MSSASASAAASASTPPAAATASTPPAAAAAPPRCKVGRTRNKPFYLSWPPRIDLRAPKLPPARIDCGVSRSPRRARRAASAPIFLRLARVDPFARPRTAAEALRAPNGRAAP